MRKNFSSIVSVFLSAILLLSIVGCGGGNKKNEQAPAKTVASQEVKKEVPKEEKTGFIVGTDVNAREKASTDSAIVGTFALGEKVIILADEPEWAKVKRSDGKECYVFKKFLGDQAALDARQAKYNIKDGAYPVYLNGDSDYVLLHGNNGTAWYMVKSSYQKKKGTHIDLIRVVAVPDADKGKTEIASSERLGYWYNDVGLNYWNDDVQNAQQYVALPEDKDSRNVVALSAYALICYMRNGHVAFPGRFDQTFYNRLNP